MIGYVMVELEHNQGARLVDKETIHERRKLAAGLWVSYVNVSAGVMQVENYYLQWIGQDSHWGYWNFQRCLLLPAAVQTQVL